MYSTYIDTGYKSDDSQTYTVPIPVYYIYIHGEQRQWMYSCPQEIDCILLVGKYMYTCITYKYSYTIILSSLAIILNANGLFKFIRFSLLRVIFFFSRPHNNVGIRLDNWTDQKFQYEHYSILYLPI